MRVADFFCGGGGFSEGFRQAGFEIVFAVDKWEPAVTTYRGNKPGVNVIQDDVIRISLLSDEEFEKTVPDSEVIIGSPPCQAFSHSNKSGNGDKTLGIQLIEAYLRIIARKKAKPNSVLQYWVLENVPAVKDYIKEEYTIYEKIINLCDLMCTTKVLTVDKRMMDLLLRHGIYAKTYYHIEETVKLKEFFDNLLDYNLYDLFPEIKDNL